MGRSGTDARASTSTRRVLIGWGLLFALTSSLTVVAAAPLIALGLPRENMLLLAVQLTSRKGGPEPESGRFEDVLAAYCRLTGARRVSDEAFQEKLDELIETGLVSRRASGFQLTPEGSARLREQVEARGREAGGAR